MKLENQIQKIKIRKKESENGKHKTEIIKKKYEICLQTENYCPTEA